MARQPEQRPAQDAPASGSVVPEVDVSYVDSPSGIDTALRGVADEVVGVDVERADADRYFRRAALIQVGVAGRCVLIDGVGLEQLPALADFLGSERLTVLHALENDLDPLVSKGVMPARVADTAVAATMLGLPAGLGPLLTEVLGVELDGDKSAYQRADWEERPLSPGMAAYAAGDVVHLPALWHELETRLDAAGRRAWYEEELAAVIASVDADTRDWTRVKGAGRLSPPQRAILRALWEERERIAREHDIAPNRLLHEEVLRDLATSPVTTPTQLVRRSQRRRSIVRRHADELFAALERGVAAPPETRDTSHRWSEQDRATYDALRRRRSEVAAALGLDPGVLCPSKALWAPLTHEPADGAELCRLAGLRQWQCEVLAEPLWETYAERRAHEGADPVS